jgi:hypothetical protein
MVSTKMQLCGKLDTTSAPKWARQLQVTLAHSDDFPIYGTGQGSENSLIIWCFISSILFHSFESKAVPAQYWNPDGTNKQNWFMIGFVDDTNGQANQFLQSETKHTLQQVYETVLESRHTSWPWLQQSCSWCFNPQVGWIDWNLKLIETTTWSETRMHSRSPGSDHTLWSVAITGTTKCWCGSAGKRLSRFVFVSLTIHNFISQYTSASGVPGRHDDISVHWSHVIGVNGRTVKGIYQDKN